MRIIEADLTVTGADGSPRARPLPADHHPAGPPPLPRRRAGPALPRAVGDRVGLPGAAAHHAQRARPALAGPGRAGAGDLGAADRLPAAAHGHGRPRWRPDPAPTPTGPASPPPLQAARDQLTAARGICPDPDARPTCSASSAGPSWPPCCPLAGPATAPARSNAPPPATCNRDDGRPAPTTITAIDISLHTPPPLNPARSFDPAEPSVPRTPATNPPAPRHRDDEHRPARLEREELAEQSADPPQHAHPTRRMGPSGFLTRTRAGTYALDHHRRPTTLRRFPG